MTSPYPHAGAVALLAALALAAPAAAPASATAPPSSTPATFALYPVGPAGVLRGAPGRVLRGAVRVRNVSGRRITVVLQRADIRTASNGNADYITQKLSQTGRWLHLGAATVRLAPRALREIPFTVSVPRRTRGAAHYAGIVAVDAAELADTSGAKKAKSKSFSFRRVNRQALPLTIRLRGPLTRSLAMRSLEVAVAPAGAALVVGLLPGGSALIQAASIRLRVLRGARTVLTHASTLGQLFPRSGLDYRIAWHGRPTSGSYRVVGVIRPKGAAAVQIDRTVRFTPDKVTELAHEAPPIAREPAASLPTWVWLALGTAAALMIALSLAVWRLQRRLPGEQLG
jgi:hypothetical protein